MPELQYSVYIWPLIFSGLLALVLAMIIWRRRPGAGIVPFTALQLALVVWTLCDVTALSLVDDSYRVFFTRLSYIGITAVPVAWLLFVLEYTGHNRWVTRRTVGLLLIEPALMMIAVYTNPAEGFHAGRDTLIIGGVRYYEWSYGPLFWINAVYSYGLLLLGVALLVRAFVRSPHLYRGQITMLLIGVAAPWIGNAVFIFGIVYAPIDLTPLSFTVTGVALALSIARFRLLDIVPVARATLFESLSDAVMVLDERNRIVDINPAGRALIGAGANVRMIGQQAGDVLQPYFGDLVTRYAEVSQGRSEIVWGAEPGQRHFVLRISPLTDRFGTLTGRVFMLHEITELKHAAQQIEAQNRALRETNRQLAAARAQAEEANRLKTEFLATMSHELRTPLNSVIGYADLMLSGLMGPMPDKQTDYVARIMANGERLLALINDLLDISRIEAGRLVLLPASYDPRALLDAIRAQTLSLAEQRGLAFHTHVHTALPPLLVGDQKRLEQILVNLVGNALRFTNTGSVSVRFDLTGEATWTITVADTGIGIPPHALEYIFEEFRQVDSSFTRDHGGTGLGLAIVRKLAMLMGGSVSVSSEVGQGSTFVVQLPVVVPGDMPDIVPGFVPETTGAGQLKRG